ncbi:transporter [Stenotrophomonas maltophilia]|uniref:transporter n=1 Tax=Stenotrophomonas maltophilia TaxID=40324 RepID=UPI0034DAD1B8
MRHALPIALPLALLLASPPTLADEVPGFDRPGIGFGTDSVPRGALAVEIGLPGFQRERDRDGQRSTTLSSDLLLRTGLAPGLELQLSSTPWLQQRQRGPDQPRTRQRGAGDSVVGLKWAGPGSTDRTAWALLASGVVARGDAAFSDGRQYALAASVEHSITDRWSGALYASHQRGDGQRSTTWSPSVALAASDRIGLYLEAGFTRARHQPDLSVAGAGLTWMLRPNVQLDASFDVGLDRDSPDLQLATGIAFYLD